MKLSNKVISAVAIGLILLFMGMGCADKLYGSAFDWSETWPIWVTTVILMAGTQYLVWSR